MCDVNVENGKDSDTTIFWELKLNINIYGRFYSKTA